MAVDFEAYLVAKKIDAVEFARSEPETFNRWKSDFGQMHPNSFTVQKLNLINPVRRKYPLRQAGSAEPPRPATPVKPVKPVIRKNN